MRFPNKFALKCAAHWKPEPSQNPPRARNRLKLVPDIARRRIESNQKSFFTELDVQFSRGVEKTETHRRIHGVSDPARVERPEAQGPGFYQDNLARGQERLGIGNPHPAEVKHRPPVERLPSRIENIRSYPKTGSRNIVRKTARHAYVKAGIQRKEARTDRRQSSGCIQLHLDNTRCRPAKGEHGFTEPRWALAGRASRAASARQPCALPIRR